MVKIKEMPKILKWMLPNTDAITFPWAIYSKKLPLSKRDSNHEFIHICQMKELLYLFFYPLYLIGWVIGGFKYENNCFEKEAFDNENNEKYMSERDRFSWMSYIN